MPTRFPELLIQLAEIGSAIRKKRDELEKLERARDQTVLEAADLGPIAPVARAAGISRNLVYTLQLRRERDEAWDRATGGES